MLCQSSSLSTVTSFVYKDTKTNGGAMKACQLSSVWKILNPIPYGILSLSQLRGGGGGGLFGRHPESTVRII